MERIIKKIRKNHILAICLGIVYLWFGILKFFPNHSPAESLAKNTVDIITFGSMSPDVSIILLAAWETLVGILLIFNIKRQVALILAFAHILPTFLPLFLFSQDSFTSPFSFTLLGQYIFKNIIIIGALVTLFKYHQNKNIAASA
ncbi:doxx family protein [Seonamhaeicola sp.]|uniref:doxx family protein n=1 Tax=Seonamhaeicola sp. TaxID=1912245 RepID=UPI0026370D56|nr:doxx family protein [Seonamhaeicola sp.]